MKPPQRVHAVLWFRGTLRIPDERQSSRLSKPLAPLARERSHIGGGSDGACHYGDINSREFVAVNCDVHPGKSLRSKVETLRLTQTNNPVAVEVLACGFPGCDRYFHEDHGYRSSNNAFGCQGSPQCPIHRQFMTVVRVGTSEEYRYALLRFWLSKVIALAFT